MGTLPTITATILLVDDEPAVRRAVKRTLQVDGYRIVEASSAHEALAWLWRNTADVMITDHAMPHMTGLELLRRARVKRPHLQTLMLTGQADGQTAEALISERLVYRLVYKPFEGADLRAVVKQAVHEARIEAMALLQRARDQRGSKLTG